MKHIMIFGGKGFTKNYGGWETHTRNLIYNWEGSTVKFYVAELVHNKDEKGVKEIDGVTCPQIYVPNIGSATMVLFCLKALFWFMTYINKYKVEKPIIYILGNRIGPVFPFVKGKLNRMGASIIFNPDGLEWKRAKWNWLVKTYFKFSEVFMVKYSNALICDSMAIEKYIKEKYKNYKPLTRYIAYGTESYEANEDTVKLHEFYRNNNIEEKKYYLIVGRFVPENNYELIIREYMSSNADKPLVIISNVSNNTFYKKLKESTQFDKDSRIRFVGTVYDRMLLTQIRKNAFAYLHGHSAGGTNPSLLEAMSTTNLNILFDVVFNKEVGQKAAFYFSETSGSLKQIIEETETLDSEKINSYGLAAKKRMEFYSWEKVVKEHEQLFNHLNKGIEPVINFGQSHSA
jgi:rhamnosyltransferase